MFENIRILVWHPLFLLMTGPIETRCAEDMTPEVPPGTIPVVGETPGTFVQNNVFEGPQYVEEVPDDDKPGPPDDVYKSVEAGPDVGLALDINGWRIYFVHLEGKKAPIWDMICRSSGEMLCSAG